MTAPSRGVVNVAEINPHAPRPFTFTEAALCLRDSIRRLGYTCDLHVNRADTAQRCIVLGALPPNLPAVDQLAPAKAAIFNFEQLGSTQSVTGEDYANWLRQWVVADYHSANIDWLRRESGGEQRAFELPVVPSESIAWRPDLPYEPEVDVLFFGTLSERRQRIIDGLQAAGLTVEVVAGSFGEELAPAIKRARIVLHVHFYETGLFPIARILQPVAQGVAIVCEQSVFSRLSDWSASGIVFAPYERLVDACKRLAANDAEREMRARRNLEFAAAIDFAPPFERLMRALDDAPVRNEEIEKMLEAEATELPPEAHLAAPAFKIAERHPGQGKYGKWIVALLILFSLYTIWLSMR
ncbi:hypothetical protein [Ramlibacter albus]|uniref:Uncharacterized protein n=1 Tax=Ramlibacter albus TaxID=2079448 RepID=A0A923M6A1_9BURK|nr:hypothetical protein [Ramlibacter albus]MBC5763556.1 hypothetical protein [Ramlibacter albus]